MLYDLDTKLDFGKHKGRVVEDVLTDDPRYLLWALENVERFEVDAAVQDAIERAAERVLEMNDGIDAREPWS